MTPFRDENELAAALRELRPTPRPEFAAELDARAAAGFPRDSRWGAALARLREWFEFEFANTPPRRLLAPAGAVAVAAVVIATAVVATTDIGEKQTLISGPSTTSDSGRLSAEPAQETAQPATAAGESAARGHTVAPSSGPYAADAGRREIERSADMVLTTEPNEIRAATGKVFDAVHSAEGIVLSSSVRDGEAPVADFELLIPSDKLGDALASFSRIAEVRSRNEATQDITAPIVGVGERLQDARATVQSLLGELADADTDEERVAVESQLRNERYRVAALRSRLSSLERRANFSRVSLRIETGSAPASEEGGGAWGVGDGVDGAGRILAVAAGVTVIGLAMLAPFALIALLAWLTRRAYLRRARRATLART